ncbi:MAG: hypothetical protein A3G80_07835 [Betaproteobacteria bacterium RIFCSPLOWO2_12_FULL_62_13b]|nr:MAG: hypothetical protein A3G80_07835 [Betaproteobacteria bacterium RIFCSPLOWO2_12_FULL_62_13b]
MDKTAILLFGRARAAVLSVLYELGEEEYLHLREIARRAAISPTAAQYELRKLVDIGLVRQARIGGKSMYQPQWSHAIAVELDALLKKLSARPTLSEKAFWTAKRVQQKADYASDDRSRKSAFLAHPQLAQRFVPDFTKRIEFDY